MAWLQKGLACFECPSSDAMVECEHHFHCFSCVKDFLKRDLDKPKLELVGKEERPPMQKKEELIDPGEYHQLKDRMISQETARKCGVTTRKYSGSFSVGKEYVYLNNEWCWVFNKYKDGKIISQKIRPCDKNKKWFKQIGDTKDKTFYGQHLHTPNPNHFVVITGGEIDMMTVMQEVNVASVSVTDGEGSLLKQMIANQEWLNKWAYVVIGMDNDKAGQLAVDKVLESNVLEPGKIRIATWNADDPNEMLKQGLVAELKKNVWNAAEYRPDDLFTIEDCLEEALQQPKEGIKMPSIMPSLHSATMGYQPNSIIVIGAADGIGKSEKADELIHGLVYEQEQKVFVLSVEQSKGETVRRQAGKILNLPLHIPNVPFNKEEIKNSIRGLDNRLIIWKPNKALTIENIIAKMKYTAIADNIKFFFIDHLKGLESYFTDVNKEMNKLFAEFKLFVEAYKATIVILSHVRKGDSGEVSFKAGRPPTTEDLHGSGAIAAWADLIILLSRNTVSDDEYERRIMRCDITKKRLMGGRGINKYYLLYDNDTGRMPELPAPDYQGEKDE